MARLRVNPRHFVGGKTIVDVAPIVGRCVRRVDAERLDGIDNLQHAFDLGPTGQPQQDVAAGPYTRPKGRADCAQSACAGDVATKFLPCARKTGETAQAGTRSVLTLARARVEPLAIHLGQKKSSLLLRCKGRLGTRKSPASEEAGLIDPDQLSLRRDQIRLKLSSPSPFTSEA
jgi:hypothetical protein